MDRLKIVLAGSAGLGTGAVAMCGWGIGSALDARYGISMGGALWGALGAGLGLISLGTVALRPAFEPGMWRLIPSVSLSMLGTTFLIGPGGSSGFPLVPPGAPWSMEAAWSLFLHGQNALTPFGWSLFGLSAVSFPIAVGGLGWTARLFENWQRELSGGEGAEKYRSKETVYGNARWGEWSKMDPIVGKGDKNGFVIGEDYNPVKNPEAYDHDDPSTWGEGGRAPLITMSGSFGSGHILMFSGSSGGKSGGFMTATCLHSNCDVFTSDPGGHVLANVRGPREEKGKKVREIAAGKGLDVLKMLEPWLKESNETYLHLASMIVTESSLNQSEVGEFFRREAINVIAALLEHFMQGGAKRPFRELLRVVTLPEKDFKTEISDIVGGYSPDHSIRLCLSGYQNVEPRFYQSFSATVQQSLRWAAYDKFLSVVSSDPPDAPDVLTAGTDVFITIEAADMRAYPSMMRLLFGAFAYCAEHGVAMERLVMVDEADVLGRMPVFETIRDRMRKNGLRLALMYQSVGQLQDAYGAAGVKSWINGVSARIYSGIEDGEELRNLSDLIGSYTVDVGGTSRSTSGRGIGISSQSSSKSQSVGVHAARLMPVDDLRALPQDAQIVFFRGQRPLLIGKPFWWRRQEWVDLVKRFL